MAEVIKMPRMSDTMTEGVIVSWLKKVGDSVKPGDVMAEVETDKATMELESYTDGVLLYIGVKEGDSVPVDSVIAVVGKKGEDYKPLLAQSAQPAEAKEATPAPAQTTPAAAPSAQAQPVAPATQPAAEARPQEAPGDEEGRVKASPLAKKLAEEKGIPLSEVSGSGDSGRIIKRDIENFKAPVVTQSAPATQVVSAGAGQEGYHDVAVSQMRKTIARRLSESKFTSPHFYLTIEINMEKVIEARKKINEFLNAKVSYNDIVIRAAAAALRRHPKVNGSWLGDKLRYYDHIHIGVAIAVEEGLLVPVVKFADTKSISQISAEIKDFAEKAKNKKLQPVEMEGNTFTVSNLGMFGIEEFTAIINPPDACILAVGAILEKAIVENGELKAANMMKVTMSCDHRIVDGATGAQFLRTFKQYLEEPLIILA